MLRNLTAAIRRPASRQTPSHVNQAGRRAKQPATAAMWRAEREYWREKLSSWLADQYNLTFHPLQEDDSTVPETSVVGQIQNTAKANPDVYFATGYRHALEFLRELHHHGFEPRQFSRILEFGVGSGRLIRQFLPFQWQLFGCDVTPDALDFARRVLGDHVQLSQTDIAPTLPYEDASFDFIYAVSVFTHIQLPATLPWIEELHRILKPGGALIATVFEANQYLPLTPREFDQLEHGTGYHEWGTQDVVERYMYMTPAKLIETWSHVFEVLELRPRFRDQSHLIVRRR